jgi:hypothetical protein
MGQQYFIKQRIGPSTPTSIDSEGSTNGQTKVSSKAALAGATVTTGGALAPPPPPRRKKKRSGRRR